jgi:hypothetical protein
MIVALCVGAGCIDSEEFSGRFLEEVQPNALQEYEQEFALRLDLFQFGDEVGGLIHFYPTRWVEGTDDSPFANEPLFCVWTDARRLGDDGTVRLTFDDWDGRQSVLTLRGGAAAETLQADKCLRDCGEVIEGDLDEKRAMVLLRDEDQGPVTRCARPLENFNFRVAFEGGFLRRALDDELEGERALTLGLAWVGDSSIADDQRLDWFFRVADRERAYEINTTRRLPPGRLRAGNTVDYVQEPGSARVSMGIPFVFKDSAQVVGEIPGREVQDVDWSREVEPLLGTPFLETEAGSGLLIGRVLMFVDGDPEALPPRVLALLEDGTSFQAGYGIYRVKVRADDFVVTAVRREDSGLLTVYGRPEEEYLDPSADPEAILATFAP